MLLPPAPVHSAITPSTQTAVTATMAAFAAGAFVYSLWHWRRSGKPVFLLLFLAGGCMMAMEPAVDTVGGVWFPRVHSWVAFTAYGRPIPVWLCLAYFFYFGIGIGVFWTIIRRGVSARQLWGLFVLGMVGDFVFEAVLLHFNTYIYYGGQPLRALKFPFWWAPVNAVIVLVAATAVARFERQLTGRRLLLIIPGLVTISAAVNAAVGWPSWLVINSRMSWAPRQVGGLATFALALWLVSLLARLLPEPAPDTIRAPARAKPIPASAPQAVDALS